MSGSQWIGQSRAAIETEALLQSKVFNFHAFMVPWFFELLLLYFMLLLLLLFFFKPGKNNYLDRVSQEQRNGEKNNNFLEFRMGNGKSTSLGPWRC